MRRSLGLLSTLACVALWLPTALAEPLKIGVIAPLSGGLASRGEEIRRTVEIYQSHYLSRPGRHSYTFLIEDGKNGLSSAATTAAHKFIEIDGVKFLISGTSGETLQVGPIAERAKVVLIGVLATAPDVRTLGTYVFRTYVDIERGIKRILQVLRHKHSRPALLSEQAPYTAGIQKLITKELGEGLAFSDEFHADETDFKMLLTRLRAKQPDAIYINSSSPQTFIPLVRQIRTLGFRQPLYSYFMPAETAVRSTLGDLLEGTVFLDTPDIAGSSPEYADFMKRYLEKYPAGPLVEFLTRTTHDAIKALTTSIEAVGPDPTAVRDYLYRADFPGALGTNVQFDEAGDIRNLDFEVKVVRGGKIVAYDHADKAELQ